MSWRARWWAGSLVAGFAWAALAAWEPSTEGVLVCLFRRTLELPCPGCGLTRAFSFLARGELQNAVTVHPLAPLLFVEALAGWGLLGISAHGRSLAGLRIRPERWLLVTASLLLALWLGRLAIGDFSALTGG